jgi:putative transposase
MGGKKGVYRLYRLEGLQLRMKVKRRKRISLQRGRPVPATGPNQHWSMDFSMVRPEIASPKLVA